jgi:hypothetical protein
MITTKGQIIEINGKTEWLLFHRLSKKVNPVDFLSLTDCIIQFPNFLFTISYLILIFINVDLKLKFIIPASLYFCGQIIVNLRLGVSIFKLLNIPLMFFQKFNIFLMAGTFITGFFFLGWWNPMIIPSYLLAVFISVPLLTSNDKKYYLSHWEKSTSPFQIFKNNSFLLAYEYYAAENKVSGYISPSDEEISDQDWLKPYTFMRAHWGEIENSFNRKARTYWRIYLHIDK